MIERSTNRLSAPGATSLCRSSQTRAGGASFQLRPLCFRIVVLLPAPLGPSRPTILPCGTRRPTPRTAATTPIFVTKQRDKPPGIDHHRVTAHLLASSVALAPQLPTQVAGGLTADAQRAIARGAAVGAGREAAAHGQRRGALPGAGAWSTRSKRCVSLTTSRASQAQGRSHRLPALGSASMPGGSPSSTAWVSYQFLLNIPHFAILHFRTNP